MWISSDLKKKMEMFVVLGKVLLPVAAVSWQCDEVAECV